MARWVKIAARRPVTKEVAQLAPPSGGRQPKDKGIRKAARDLGVTRDQVARAVKIASLSPEAKAAGRDAPQAALLAAAKEAEPAAQVAAIEAHIAKGRLAEPARYPSRSAAVCR